MAHFIDKGMKGPDDPIFREGIGIVSIRKAVPAELPTPPKTQDQTKQTENPGEKRPE